MPPVAPMPPCSPQAAEQLQVILARAFGIEEGYKELNRAITTAAGFDLFYRLYQNPGPMRIVVDDVRREVEADGKVEAVLAAVFFHLKGNFELRRWAGENRSDLLTLVSDQEHEATRTAYEEDRQKRRIGVVTTKLGGFAGEIVLSAEQRRLPRQMLQQLDELGGYKSLHDILHKMQMQVLGELDRILVGPAAEPQALGLLIFQIQEMELARTRIMGLIANHGPFRDPDWQCARLLPELDHAIEMLRANGADAARKQLRGRFELRSILRSYMPLLDDQLVRTASEIPFAGFARTLRDIAHPAVGGPGPELVKALDIAGEALIDIGRRLDWRRDVHQDWQLVDAKLWQLEEVLRGVGMSEELLFLWEDLIELRGRIEAINPGRWTSDLDQFSPAIEHAAAADFATIDPPLRSAFSSYAHTARMEFLQTDWALLQDCEKLKALKTPLELLTGD